MRPTLRQLQYLTAIAETGRFGEAAKRLNVSQPGLSSQISNMEEELGAVLIERAPSGALLTPKGLEIAARAKHILRDVEDLKAVARHDADQLEGLYRIGVLPIVGPYLLPLAVRQLHAKFPLLRFHVREEPANDLETHLHEGLFDTIISSVADHSRVHHVSLFDEELWICVAPDDPLARDPDPVALSDLEGRLFLTLGSRDRLNVAIENIADAAGAIISNEYEGTSLDSVRQMAEMGAGIAVLPSLYALSEARRDPHLKIRRIEHQLASHPISLIWRESSPLAPNLITLGSALQHVAAELLSENHLGHSR
ncbi:LysR family transcriptional regulator [Hyphomonas johnsonii]|uniref:LysR family transcriptional regulator n=1 Tax=Hyphomonas johnsonii MHS-2 TaxID=1280950 RepID=A0A059FRY2_9PROT|nr:LysR substrate-binding domain-containing protein [Hyphomonas johnsonii]KCZ93419.1 LysR family transcriptional regulator [Hyphomonas johnsonii MHS-2]